MPIPDFQTLMRPLLQHLSDGADHSNQETASVLADQFHLSEDERTQLLPSGKQSVFEMTPEEHIDYGYKQIRQKLSIEILDRIKKCPPDFFERLVVDLIVPCKHAVMLS